MKRIALIVSVLVAGCSSNPGGSLLDAGTDLGEDATSSDAALDATPADLGQLDLGADDAGLDAASDAGDLDAALDLGDEDLGVVDDAGSDDAGICDYIDLTPFATDCSGEMTVGWSWVNVGGVSEECPTYYEINGAMGSSELAAISEAGCSPICVYHATIAVDLLHCGHRFGYEQWEEGREEICPNMISVGGEFYPDWETYQASHPCE